MIITKENVAEKISDYLHHKLTLAELVNWAENAMMNESFDEAESAVLSEVVGYLGLADVRTFGLQFEDCENLLKKLGFTLKVRIEQAV
ncbi:MAG: hypothetical protein FJ213_12020 [Ignavibacteria bacterium]|nr:hypothetical protein [Ignavibacteria bacterium]